MGRRTGTGIALRIASAALPHVTVVRLGDDAQYSSHVVNLVVPGFGDSFLQDDFGFELQSVAKRFYRDFEDTYDTLSVVPEAAYLASYGAFHRTVRNDVRGAGLMPMDDSLSYGSVAHRLQSAEIFLNESFTRSSSTSHELADQWGGKIDWSRLAGITAAGYPVPAHLHPYTLYAMGLLARDQVPTVSIFDQQGQFNPGWISTPAVGTPVVGSARSVTVFNVASRRSSSSDRLARRG